MLILTIENVKDYLKLNVCPKLNFRAKDIVLVKEITEQMHINHVFRVVIGNQNETEALYLRQSCNEVKSVSSWKIPVSRLGAETRAVKLVGEARSAYFPHW